MAAVPTDPGRIMNPHPTADGTCSGTRCREHSPVGTHKGQADPYADNREWDCPGMHCLGRVRFMGHRNNIALDHRIAPRGTQRGRSAQAYIGVLSMP